MDGFKEWEKYLRETFKLMESASCQHVKEHQDKGRIAFICEAPNCSRRLICSLCILSDDDHKRSHKNHIKTIAKGADCLIERSRDFFSRDMEMIAKDASEKYVSKLKSCAKLAQELFGRLLVERLEIGRSAVEDHFADKVLHPVKELSNLSIQRLQAVFSGMMAQPKQNSGDNIEGLFDYLDQKATEDTFVWETAGKTIQRLKHQILYNKQIEQSLSEDIDRIVREFTDKLVETYKSYFFVKDDLVVHSHTGEPKATTHATKESSNLSKVDQIGKSGAKSEVCADSQYTLKSVHNSKAKADHRVKQASPSKLTSPTKLGKVVCNSLDENPSEDKSLNQAIILSEESRDSMEETLLAMNFGGYSTSPLNLYFPRSDEISEANFNITQTDNREKIHLTKTSQRSPSKLSGFSHKGAEKTTSPSACKDQTLAKVEKSRLSQAKPQEELGSPGINLHSSLKGQRLNQDSRVNTTSQCFKKLQFTRPVADRFSGATHHEPCSCLEVFGGVNLVTSTALSVTEVIFGQEQSSLQSEEPKLSALVEKDHIDAKTSQAYLSLAALSPSFPLVSCQQIISVLSALPILRSIPRSSWIKVVILNLTDTSQRILRSVSASAEGILSSLDYTQFRKCLLSLATLVSQKSKFHFTSCNTIC